MKNTTSSVLASQMPTTLTCNISAKINPYPLNTYLPNGKESLKMRPIEPTCADGAAIIPFAPRSYNDKTTNDETRVSTIVAIVAVTLRHDADISPEEELADLIEATGEADIIEIQDACAEIMGADDGADSRYPSPSNDNTANDNQA